MITLGGRLKRKLLRSIALPSSLASLPVEVAGTSFRVPFIDGVYCDAWEPWMLELPCAERITQRRWNQ